VQRSHVSLQVLATSTSSQVSEATAAAQVTPVGLLPVKKIKPAESTQSAQVLHNTGQCVFPCTSVQALFLHANFSVIKSVVNLKALLTQAKVGGEVAGGEVVGGDVVGGDVVGGEVVGGEVVGGEVVGSKRIKRHEIRNEKKRKKKGDRSGTSNTSVRSL